MAVNSMKFNIGFNVDRSQLVQLRQQFNEIYSMTQRDFINEGQFKGTQQELLKIQQIVSQAELALDRCFNQKLNTTSIEAYNKELKESGTSLKEVQTAMVSLGPRGAQAFNSLSNTVMGSNLKLKATHNTLNEISKTLTNSLKWSLSYGAINMFTQGVSSAFSYVKQLDESLNNIRIVTGKSSEEMAQFAKHANKAAKELGATTTAYTDAALIYYQQGLGEKDVQARANVTLKAANVTGQSASEVSEQLTAVWNGYKVSAEEAELYIDKLAAVAATTAADLEELSTGMSKVASAASTMGIDMDQLNAQLATIVSVTRQAPESVGTALKTIYARMGDLKLGQSDEDGVQLGEVSSDLEQVGIKVIDATGNLRDMGDVVTEVGNKWETWSRAEQQAIAISLAGKRQYNNLIALFENWSMYEDALQTSVDSVGTLSEQNEIYLDSMEAHLNQLKTSAEGLYASLFDNEGFNTLVDGASGVVSGISWVVDTIGGIKPILIMLTSVLMLMMSKSIGSGIATMYANMQGVKTNAQHVAQTLEHLRSTKLDGVTTDSERILNQFNEIHTFWAEMYQKGIISAEDYNRLVEATHKTSQMAHDLNVAKADRSKAIGAIRRSTGMSEEDAQAIMMGKTGTSAPGEGKQNYGTVQDVASGMRDKLSAVNSNPLMRVKNAVNKSGGINAWISQDNLTNLQKNIDVFPEEAATEVKSRIERLMTNITKESEEAKQAVSDDVKAIQRLVGQNADEVEQDIEQVTQSAGQDIRQMGQELDQALDPITLEQKQMAMQTKISTWINNISTMSMGLLYTWQTISSIWDILSDETLSDTEKFGQIVTNILTMLPMLLMMVPTLQSLGFGAKGAATGLAAAGVGAKGAATGFAALQATLWPLLIVVGLLIAAFAVFKGLSSWYNKDANAAKEATENAKKLQQAYEDLKTSYENLKKSFDEYDKGKEVLDEMVEGTKEWKDQVEKLNDQVKELLRQYPQLAKYVTNEDGVLTISEENQQKVLDELDAATNRADAAAIAGRQAQAQAEFVANATATGRLIGSDESRLAGDIGNNVIGAVGAGSTFLGGATLAGAIGTSGTGLIAAGTASQAVPIAGQIIGAILILAGIGTMIYAGMEAYNAGIENAVAQIAGLSGESLQKIATYFANNPEVIIDKNSLKDAYKEATGEEASNAMVEALLDNTGAIEALVDQARAIIKIEQINKDDQASSYLKSFNDTEYNQASVAEQSALNRVMAVLLEDEDILNQVKEHATFNGDEDAVITNVKTKYADSQGWTYDIGTDSFKDVSGKQIAEDQLVDYDTMEQTVKNLIAAEIAYKGQYKTAATSIFKLTGQALGNTALEAAYAKLAQGTTGGTDVVELTKLTQSQIGATLKNTRVLLEKGELDPLLESLNMTASQFEAFLERTEDENDKLWQRAISSDRIGVEASNAINALNLDWANFTTAERTIFGDLYKNATMYGDDDAVANMSAVIKAAGDREAELAQILAQNTSLTDDALMQKLREEGFDITSKTMESFFADWGEIAQVLNKKTLADWQNRYKNDQKVLKDLQLGSIIDPEVYNQLSAEQKTYFSMMADGTYMLTKSAKEFYAVSKEGYQRDLTNQIQDSQRVLDTITALQLEENKVKTRSITHQEYARKTIEDMGINRDAVYNKAQELGGFNSDAFLDYAATYYPQLIQQEFSNEYKEYQKKVRGGIINPITNPFNGNMYDYRYFDQDLFENGVKTDQISRQWNTYQLDPTTRELFKAAKTIPGIDFAGLGISEELFTKAVLNAKFISEEERQLFIDALDKIKATDFSAQIEAEEQKIREAFDAIAGTATSFSELDSLLSQGKIDQLAYDAQQQVLISSEAQKYSITGEELALAAGADTKDQAKWLQAYAKKQAVLKTYEARVDSVASTLNRLEKQEEDLTGNKLIENLNKQSAALKREGDALSELIAIKKQDIDVNMKRKAESLGIEDFDWMAEDAVTKIQDALNDPTIDDNRRKELEAFLEYYKKELDAYDKLLESQLENQRAQLQNFFDGLNAKVQIDLDLQEAETKMREFERDFIDFLRDDDVQGTMDFAVGGLMNGRSQAIIASSLNSAAQIATYEQQTAASVEEMGKHIDTSIDQLGTMKENIETIFQSYLDAIEAVTNAFDKQREVLDNLNGVYDHYVTLTELAFGEDAYSEIGKFLALQNEVAKTSVESAASELDIITSEMAKVRDKIAQNNFVNEQERQYYEDYLNTLEENYMAALDTYYGTIETLAQGLKDEFENTINREFDTLVKSLSGGAGLKTMKDEWELMQLAGKSYYDDVNRAYEISKLENKMRQSINANSSLATQRKLNNVMNEELKKLREKDKLSKYDLQRAQLMYDIELKKIALEEAQANKVKMRLRRDANGNYSYQFVSDADEIAKTEQELADLQNQLYNLDVGEYKGNLESIISLTEEFEEKRHEILMSSMTDEEKEKAIAELTAAYDGVLNARLEDNERLKELFSTGIWAGVGLEAVDKKYQAFADSINAKGGFAETMAATNASLAQAAKETDAAINNLYDTAINKLSPVEKEFGKISTHVSNIIEKLTGKNGTLGSVWTQITSQEFKNAVTTFNNLAASIQTALDNYIAFIKKVNDKKLVNGFESETDWNYNNFIDSSRIENKFKDYDTYQSAMTDFNTLLSKDSSARQKSSAYAHLDQGFLNVLWFLTNASGQTLIDPDTWSKLGTPEYENHPYVKGKNSIYNAMSGDYSKYLEWWLKSAGLSGFNTGGYTGAWGDNGKLAMLHEKELVLNKFDTANILSAVDIVRSMQGILDNLNDSKIASLITLVEGAVLAQGSSGVAQDVRIEAHFPNVTDKSEIEAAFDELINLAYQRANQ